MDIEATLRTTLLTPRPASDSAREDRLKAAAEDRLRDARAAVETLKQRRTEASEERKAMARQRIEQLKARLQLLKSMAAVDPKGTGRLAAQLARELGAAVKAYAAAGGVTSGGGVAAAPAPSAASPVAEGQAAEVGGEPRPPEEYEPGEPAAGDETRPESEGDRKPANPYQQAVDEANARAAELMRRSGEKQADSDFLTEVRKLAAEIKQLVRQAAAKKSADDDALSPEEAREMRAVVDGMDRAIEQASADLGAGVFLLA